MHYYIEDNSSQCTTKVKIAAVGALLHVVQELGGHSQCFNTRGYFAVMAVILLVAFQCNEL